MGLELNRPVFAVLTLTADSYPGPIANTTLFLATTSAHNYRALILAAFSPI